jgi:hypothetical protein
MALTGRFNFRRSWFGKLVLEVEEEAKPMFGGSDKKPVKHRWRRATLLDLAQPEMRALIDLRFQPQFMARTAPRPAEVPQVSKDRADERSAIVTALPLAQPVTPQRTSH